MATLSGIRHPIVVILLLISFFTAISGKPLDGLLLLIVAAGLARDEGTRQAGGLAGAALTEVTAAEAGLTEAGRTRDAVAGAVRPPAGLRPGGPAAVRRRPAVAAVWLACGVLYAAVVGSFARYSWPATIAVIVVGAAAVLVGWHGPVRGRRAAELPLPGTVLWGGLVVAGGLWELAALLQQPDLTIDSAAHPTVSTLTDPLLGSHPGRSLALAIWLVLGWLVIQR